MTSVLRAAAVQMNSTPDRARNLATADRLTRAAAADGAELVVLPETWNLLGSTEQLLAGAEPLDGPSITWAREIAAELAIDLVAGSIMERAAHGEKVRNTTVHVSSSGDIEATYRKIHLFDVEVGDVVYRESDAAEPGDEITVSRTGSGVELGLSVCYDLRFPELFRILALRGARVLVLPSAFTLVTTRAHWEVLLRARAIENQAFVVAPNQIGTSIPGEEWGGHSLIVDPWGVVLAAAPGEETFVIGDLDLEGQAEVRRTLPSLANRRPTAYRRPEGDSAVAGFSDW